MPNNNDPQLLSDRELLLRINERTERLTDSVFGNGQPGILQRLTTAEERVDAHLRDIGGDGGAAKALGRLAVVEDRLNAKDRTAIKTGGVVAAVVTAILAVLSRLGVHIG